MSSYFVTIDGPTTRDMDDAVWVDKTSDGWRVYVAVSDVAGRVPPGSEDDLAAREKLVTVYRPWGNVPMLPTKLSEDELSLRQHKRRNILVVAIELDAELNVQRTILAQRYMRSRARLNYGDIPAILRDEAHAERPMLAAASELAMRLLDKRRRGGAMAIYDLTHNWITTEEGYLREVKDPSETLGQILIQELMILANQQVAIWAIEHDVPVLFRNHTARVAAPQRSDVLAELEDALHRPVADLQALQTRMLLYMNRADYGPTLRGHYGLNLPAYLHFTSPIRRYVDLIVHRQVRARVLDQPLPYTQAELEALALEVNARLREQDEALAAQSKAKAVTRAERAIEHNHLDRLDDAGFERVVKVQIRSGEAPHPNFQEAFLARLKADRCTMLELAVVLIQAPRGELQEAWKPLREAILRHLAANLHRAPSLLAIAEQLPEGWAKVEYRDPASPQRHPFEAIADVAGVLQGFGWGSTKKTAQQRAALDGLARWAGCPMEEAPDLNAPRGQLQPATMPRIDTTRDAIIALNEWSQKSRLPQPTYSYDLKGPPHAPQVTCTATHGTVTATGKGSSKAASKVAAANALRTLILTSATNGQPHEAP